MPDSVQQTTPQPTPPAPAAAPAVPRWTKCFETRDNESGIVVEVTKSDHRRPYYSIGLLFASVKFDKERRPSFNFDTLRKHYPSQWTREGTLVTLKRVGAAVAEQWALAETWVEGAAQRDEDHVASERARQEGIKRVGAGNGHEMRKGKTERDREKGKARRKEA
jgi:hypothetical protein